MIYSVIRPLFFKLNPETAHNFTLQIASLCPTLGNLTGTALDPRMSLKVGSVKWKFPIGLAAGLDKNAEALDFFNAQGFGAIECGTLTLKPQVGNPKPRMFRYPEEQSLRNAMGFPNHGLLEIMPRLNRYEGGAPLGINIGKNKDSSAKDSIEELSIIFDTLKESADYFVINVSSPNTPGLRAFQDRNYLSELFSELKKDQNGPDLYLKLAPDLDFEKIIDLTRLVAEFKLSGIIATNTAIMPERGMGGISGLLLREKSKEIRRVILKENENLELIAVGGITQPSDLIELWKDGGKAAQVYTAYVYQGPKLLKDFHDTILNFINFQNTTLSDFFKLPMAERKYRLKDFPT